MPNKELHIDQAERNHAFWNSLHNAPTPYLDWVVNGMFYEAVHWIEAYLATNELHSSTHFQRSQTMTRVPKLDSDPHLKIDYGVLRTDSENARYLCRKYSATEIANDLVPIIKRIERTMRSLL